MFSSYSTAFEKDQSILCLTWPMSYAAYCFAASVSESGSKLTALQKLALLSCALSFRSKRMCPCDCGLEWLGLLDEQIDIALSGLGQVHGYAAFFDAFDEFFALEAHQVHGHVAGHEAGAGFLGALDQ